MPDGVLSFQKKLDTKLAQTLLMAGVIHYLPLLAKWSIDEGKLSKYKLSIFQRSTFLRQIS